MDANPDDQPLAPEGIAHWRSVLQDSTEGNILRAGLLMGLAYVLWLVVSFVFTPERFQALLGMTFAHVFAGRAAGLSTGYTMDFGHGLVIPLNIAIETIMVMLFYPLFVFSTRRMLGFGPLFRFMERMTQAAHKHRHKMFRYGIPGLFLFVCIPFWMTGPLVGSALGFIMGLRGWLNMGIVLGGTYLATLGWALLLHDLNERLANIGPWAPALLLMVIIGMGLLGVFLGRRKA